MVLSQPEQGGSYCTRKTRLTRALHTHKFVKGLPNSLTVREADAPAAVPAAVGPLNGADEPPTVVHGSARTEPNRTESVRAPTTTIVGPSNKFSPVGSGSERIVTFGQGAAHNTMFGCIIDCGNPFGW